MTDDEEIELVMEPGSVYVRAMVEVIDPATETSDASKWPIPYPMHDIETGVRFRRLT